MNPTDGVIAMRRLLTLCCVAVSASMPLSGVGEADETVKKSSRYGFDSLEFKVKERSCLLVIPKTTAPGKPWIWRTEFFGHEPQADIALLGKGFHVAYMNMENMYGAPAAMELMDAFYAHLTAKYGLSPKVVLEGFSRGGLFAFNWAERNPEKVSCVYGDAPVCDFKSWPGAKVGKGCGSAGDWSNLLKVYGLTEQEALAYKLNPVDNLKPMANAKVPVLIVCGATDDPVPVVDNCGLLAERYRAMGGEIKVISKPFCGHHPHSLQEPAPIVDFILRHTAGFELPPAKPDVTPYGYDYFILRGGLHNCRLKFLREKTGRVAFIGGSITEMSGWRELVCKELQKRFPETKFDFVFAGISSLGSTPGAFRFSRDVLAKGPVDLLFSEAAVNDEVNGQNAVEQIRGVEGIVRQARLANPAVDIVLVHFVDPGKMNVIRKGKTPEVIINHEKVAGHYNLPSIDLAREVTERINANEFTWEKDFKDLHPAPFGHDVYAKTIARLFDAAWTEPPPADAQVKPYQLPAKPLDEKSYFRGKLVDVKSAELGDGWKIDPAWKPSDNAGTRPGFVNVPMLVATEPGATLKLKFEGTGVGVFVAAGPDAGTVEYRIDGGATATRDLFAPWSGGMHLPWAQVLAPELAPGPHELELRVAPTANEKSKGHAVRIAYFLVN